MPRLIEIEESYRHPAVVFSKGQPIGDGVGVLVVAKLAEGLEKTRYEIVKYTIVQELEFENRKVYVVRAARSGGTVGRPGEVVKRLVESLPERPKLIVTIDAALKLEETGKIAEGVGVAIGGPASINTRLGSWRKAVAYHFTRSSYSSLSQRPLHL